MGAKPSTRPSLSSMTDSSSIDVWVIWLRIRLPTCPRLNDEAARRRHVPSRPLDYALDLAFRLTQCEECPLRPPGSQRAWYAKGPNQFKENDADCSCKMNRPGEARSS